MGKNDFRKNKTWLRAVIINLALKTLKIAGKTPRITSAKKTERIASIDRRKSYFVELVEAGYIIRKLTEYQYRINEALDVYPKNAKWHDLENNIRGSFHGKNLATFVRKYFNEI